MDEVRATIERGDAPKSPNSRELARSWNALAEEFIGGDAGIGQSLGAMYEAESKAGGMDIKAMRPLFEFIHQAS